MRRLLALVGLALTSQAAGDTDLTGTWVLTRGGSLNPPAMTEAGASFRRQYDFKHDDPSLLCIPASWTRVFSNPNTPFEISQSDTHIRIRHELFDIDRQVPLSTLEYEPGDLAYPTLGDSIAWYEGDELRVYTKNYGNDVRVLSTIRNWAGLPQSSLLVTLERWRLKDGLLSLDITHFDPAMYTEPLVASYRFRPETEWSVENYDCEPEEAMVITPGQVKPESVSR